MPKNEVSTEDSFIGIIGEKEKSMINEKKKVSVKCQRCGRCCRLANELLQSDATPQDLARWIQERRYDILSFVGPIIDPDSEDAMFDIWVDLRTHDYVEKCPWLRKERGADLYECTIHDVKPAACREWPSRVANAERVACPACQDIKNGRVSVVFKKGLNES